MKTKPMQHQSVGVERLREAPDYFALGCEQGTGKTWMLLADAEAQFTAGEIRGLFIIAPKGVHTNWIRREIPKHMSVPVAPTFWKSGASQKHKKELEKQIKMNDERVLMIHAMNIDAVNTVAGFAFAKRFLNAFSSMLVIDESQRIKNPGAKRTKKTIELGHLAASRRIASGTLVSNSPMDVFSQYDFLAAGILGTRSYRAFVSEYAEVLPPTSPLVEEIMRRTKSRGVPQIIAKDSMGRPKYRNLDKLSKLMSPYTYRVLKSDCLDLPEKIYKTYDFELSTAQQRVYNGLRDDLRFEYDGELDTFTSLTIINKLRTATSGFVLVDGEPILTGGEERLKALLEIVDDLDGKFIVWASFREELRMIAAALKPLGVVEYHGGTKEKDRETAIDSFQDGDARVFVGNPAAAGTGLTLHAAETAIYFSSSYSLEERLQSEDRCHRIGLRHPVVFIDLVATGTIDERIAAALQSKRGTAEEILGGII